MQKKIINLSIIIVLFITIGLFAININNNKKENEIKNVERKATQMHVKVHLKGLKITVPQPPNSVCSVSSPNLEIQSSIEYHNERTFIYSSDANNNNDSYYLEYNGYGPIEEIKFNIKVNYEYSSDELGYFTAEYNSETSEYEININREFRGSVACDGGGYPVNVKIKKEWDDNNNELNKRPESIEFYLNTPRGNVGICTASKKNDWTCSISGSSSDFVNIYTVVEKSSSDYECTNCDKPNEISYTYPGNNRFVNLTFKNKLKEPEKISFNVQKIWDDNNNIAKKRPESVIIQLKKNGEIIEEKVLSEEYNWKYTFNNLLKYDSNNKEIKYTVDEKETSKFYTKKIEGSIITNTFTVPDDKITIEGKKIWEDENNKNNSRPNSITVLVKNKDEVVEEREVTSDDEWKYIFTLPKYDDLGNEIEYTIDEKDIESYQKEIDGYNIINKYYENKITNPDTRDNSVLIIFLALISLVSFIILKNKLLIRKTIK